MHKLNKKGYKAVSAFTTWQSVLNYWDFNIEFMLTYNIIITSKKK